MVMMRIVSTTTAGARLIAAAGAAAVWMAVAGTPVLAAPEKDKPAPELVVTALDGQVFDLEKLKGKVVLVNYWATWCAPCKKDMPKLDAFYRRHHAENLEMIGISIDQPRDFAKVRKMTGSLAYPLALHKDVSDDGFGPPQGVPMTWIIDAGGTVRDYMIDVRDELLDGIVLPLLRH
jgi:cytochrome c biogenesis protein CcmG, thiol:disulfide interchange protein DsbE